MLILFQSLIIGGLIGISVGVGAAKLFHIPEKQAMGAFRTLGELNACKGDAVSHFSFGLGFLFNAWASIVGAGAFTQDVVHRVITNWTASAVIRKNSKLEDTLHNPKKMGLAGGVIGAIVIALLMTTAAGVPESLQNVATSVLSPAAAQLIDLVMPIVFLLAAIDAGKRSGFWGTLFGGVSQMVMGNAVPGVVLGILIGKGVDDLGWVKSTKVLLSAVIVLFVLSAFFRGVDLLFFEQIGVDVPQWLQSMHDLISIG